MLFGRPARLFHAQNDAFHSLTEEPRLKGSHLAIKEGNTQKQTQSVKQHGRQPAADRKGPFHFVWVFPYKLKSDCFLVRQTIATVNTCVLASLYAQTGFLATLYKFKQRDTNQTPTF